MTPTNRLDNLRVKCAAIVGGIICLICIFAGVVFRPHSGTYASNLCFGMGVFFAVMSGLVLVRSRVAILLLVAFSIQIFMNAFIDFAKEPTKSGLGRAVGYMVPVYVFIEGALAIFRHHKAKRKTAEVSGS